MAMRGKRQLTQVTNIVEVVRLAKSHAFGCLNDVLQILL